MTSPALNPAAPSAPRAAHGRMHLLMLLVTVCWASNIIAGKEALTGFGPLALAQVRVLGVAIIYALCFLPAGGLRHLHLPRRIWWFLAAMALNGVALNQLTFIGGMARSTVAHTGLIVAMGPVMVLVIAVLIRLEPLTAGKLAGMMIAFAGAGILTSDKAGQGIAAHWAGDLILLVGTMVFAVYIILVKEVVNDLDGLTLNTITFVLGALIMLPFCAHALVNTPWASISPKAWWGLAFLVIPGSAISYMIFAYVMTELPASRVAAFSYLQPVIASGLGIWVLSERLTAKVVIGGSLILAGVYLAERERGEKKDAGDSEG